MNQNLTSGWTPVERVIFRFLFTYFVLFFVFIPQLFPIELFPFLDFLNLPFKYITVPFISWVGDVFFQIEFTSKGVGDSLFGYVTSLTLFIISILITIGWSLIDKREAYRSLYAYMHLYTRYFLVYILFSYGIHKLSGVQFYPPQPARLIQPFGELTHYNLFWSFMGASRSYTFFSGLMETICGLLLLFRKTSTIGALLTIGTLGHVLMLNIGYDVMIKLRLSHYLLMAMFIMAHHAKSLYNLLILHKPTFASALSLAIRTKKYQWVLYALKLSFVGYMLFSLIKGEAGRVSRILDKPPHYGIYEVEEFYLNNQSLPPLTTDTIRWKRMATNFNVGIIIQCMDDSQKFFTYKLDTSGKTLKLNNPRDKNFKCELQYDITPTNNYLFKGILNTDSVRILMRKIDIDSLPLIRDSRKIKWIE